MKDPSATLIYLQKKLNTKHTSFPVASVTKTMTSTAILQLQEQGRLRIEDPYIKYFPQFPYPTVTIKQLLSHTSGLPSGVFYRLLDSMRNAKDSFFTNADVIPALQMIKTPLVDDAMKGGRSAFSYSNLNYYLLAILIEKVSGMPYAGYLGKNIFLPAGVEHSGFSEFYFGWDKNQIKEHRFRYLYSDLSERIDTVAAFQKIFSTYNFKGHGDVTSTTHDLLKYDEALYNKNLLSDLSLAIAYHPVVPGNPENSGYGLGWSIPHDNSKGKVVFHHGGGLGIEVMFVRNISKRQTIILFDNFKNPLFYRAMDVLRILNGEKLPLPKKSIARSYGKAMVKDGIPAARKLLQQLRKDTFNYSLSEYEMNLLGYQLMENNWMDLAFEVFKTDIELFPESWNVYDSYGEILAKMGRKAEAIAMYQKSLALNPENENGKEMLKQLFKEKD